MLLTKRYLRKLLENMRTSLSENRQKELLEWFGQTCIDTDGFKRDYTEQDIYENVRKVVLEEEMNKKVLPPDIVLKHSKKKEEIPF